MRPAFTLARAAKLAGIGLHTGEKCSVSFLPAPRGAGITFLRADIPSSRPIPARLEFVDSTVRGTNLSFEGARVHTVEHVLAACAAFGVTDLSIEMDGPEPPVMDGSSKAFAGAFAEAGVAEQGRTEELFISSAVEYKDGEVAYEAMPSDGPLSYAFTFLHKHPLVKRQEYAYFPGAETFSKDIAPARTFGFEEELEYLKKAGLAKGGSLDNAVVIARDGFLTSEGGLRYPDELVRHKLLDMTGDLWLLGLPLAGMRVNAVCGGHKHNVAFAKLLQINGVRR